MASSLVAMPQYAVILTDSEALSASGKACSCYRRGDVELSIREERSEWHVEITVQDAPLKELVLR